MRGTADAIEGGGGGGMAAGGRPKPIVDSRGGFSAHCCPWSECVHPSRATQKWSRRRQSARGTDRGKGIQTSNNVNSIGGVQMYLKDFIDGFADSSWASARFSKTSSSPLPLGTGSGVYTVKPPTKSFGTSDVDGAMMMMGAPNCRI